MGEPETAAIGAVIGTVGGFLASRGADQFKEIGASEEARRNHHLKFAIASSLRVALAESRPADKHARLFEAWDAMLERATKEPVWLNQLLPGDALESSLASANQYRDEDERRRAAEMQEPGDSLGR